MTFGYRLVLINGVLDSFALLISNSFSVLINRKRYHIMYFFYLFAVLSFSLRYSFSLFLRLVTFTLWLSFSWIFSDIFQFLFIFTLWLSFKLDLFLHFVSISVQVHALITF